MALAHTILAALGNESYSGYDLWKKFSTSIKCYWQASQQQIYRELGKLEKEGAIASEIILQEGRPDKKIYRITELGVEKLKKWLLEPAEPMAIREEILVKVIASQLLPKSIILQELKRRRELHAQQLAVYKEIQQEEFSDVAQLSYEDKCYYLTLRRGIRYESEWIDWCDEAIALLKEA